MLSEFKTFYLYKKLSEVYHRYYLPYLNESTGGGRKRSTTIKGKPVEPHDNDREFIIDVKKQIPGIGLPNILMVYYQLLGSGHHKILKNPNEPESNKNQAFAWVVNKSEPDENGMTNVTVEFRTAGRGLNKKSVTTKVNLKSLKDRLKAAGYDTDNQQQLNSILNRSLPTWSKVIKEDKEAPEGSKYNFTIRPFAPDYHATQVAESPGFKARMDDKEFADNIAGLAVKAAATATGISVDHKNGFNYSIKSTKGKKINNLSGNDLDDAVQSAIDYLSSQSAAEPDKLDDQDWIKSKLKTGAMNHVRDLIRAKGYVAGTSNTGGDNDDGQLDVSDDDNARKIDNEPAVKQDDEFGDVGDLSSELQDVKDKLKYIKDPFERKKLMQRGIQIEKDLELARKKLDGKQAMKLFMQRYDRKRPEPIARQPVHIPDVAPMAASYSMADDDDMASPEDLLKYRRRMSVEGFTFQNYLKYKEM